MRNNSSKAIEVIDLIQEEPGNLSIDKFIDNLPSSKNKLQEYYNMLVDHLKEEMLAQKELETKKKDAQTKINNTEPVKALKRIKKELKAKQLRNDSFFKALQGVKGAAKVMGIELKTNKAVIPGRSC